jgi:lysylphosphatidylglycerol synthetase-like protein (DUF2156 family)
MIDPQEHEAARFEYNHLRQEQQHNGTLQIQVLGGTLLVAATLMTVGLNDRIPNDGIRALFFTLAAAVLTLGRNFAVDRRITECTLASYLRFLERQGYNLHWETRIAELHSRVSKYKFDFFTTYQRIISTLFFAANLVLVLYYTQEELRKSEPWLSPNVPIGHYLLWGGVISSFLLVAFYNFRSYRQLQNTYEYFKDNEKLDKMWDEIASSSP